MSAWREAWDRDGFLHLQGRVDQAHLEELRRELDRYVREVVPALPDSQAFYVDRSRPETLKQMQHMGVDPYFSEYRRSPQWLALAEELLGEPVEIQEPEWFNKPPGAPSPTPPHQDNFYFCLDPPQVLTFWIPLDPVDRENGCLHYLPGSHRRGIRPHGPSRILGFSQGILDWGPADEAAEVAMPLEPGDLLAHHGNTVHRADPNRSADRQRRAFALVVRGVSCRRNEAAYERYQAALRSQHQSLGLQPEAAGSI